MIYNKEKPLRCFFAFEGYNSQGLALNRLKEIDKDFEWICVGRSEIEKNAIIAADALFPENKDKNYGDISKINWCDVPDFDLFTYSFPCQSVSQAGKQAGFEEGSGTRSSLLWECRKAIIAKKPKYLVMENVKALISAKFLPIFNRWQAELQSYGYSNFAKVLNSKDYGVPQNRERIFCVSILDCEKSYNFPKPIKLEYRLKDILDKDVNEKYFLSDKLINNFNNINKKDCDDGLYSDRVKKMLKKGKILNEFCFINSYEGKVHKEITSTIAAGDRGLYWLNVESKPKIEVIGQIGEYSQRKVVNPNGISPTVMKNHGNVIPITDKYRIRKLTEREAFRLMGLKDNEIDKIIGVGIAKTNCYKLAGNSIVVDVLYHIFRTLLVETESQDAQLSLF